MTLNDIIVHKVNSNGGFDEVVLPTSFPANGGNVDTVGNEHNYEIYKAPNEGSIEASWYKALVLSQDGTITSNADTSKIINGLDRIGILNSLLFAWAGGMGIDIRTSGINNYAAKLYSVNDANDAVQATNLNQPYISGNIAPNEKLYLKNTIGENRYIVHPEFNFAATDKWSISTMFMFTGDSPASYTTLWGNDQAINSKFDIDRNGNGGMNINFTNTAGTSHAFAYNLKKHIGKITNIVLTADGNGYLSLYVNGVFQETINAVTSARISSLLRGYGFSDLTRIFKGNIYSHLIYSKALTAAEVTAQYNVLKLTSEMESVVIGSQQVTTSNAEIVTTCMGNVIPNVTDNAAWAALTTPAWCYFNNDPALGSIYGKIYNGYAMQLIQSDIDSYNVANPTAHWGWHIGTEAEWTTLITYLGGTSVAGDKMKLAGTTYWANPNTADNSSGLSILPTGYRLFNNGNFVYNGSRTFVWTSTPNSATTNINILLLNNTAAVNIYNAGANSENDLRNGCSIIFFKD